MSSLGSVRLFSGKVHFIDVVYMVGVSGICVLKMKMPW